MHLPTQTKPFFHVIWSVSHLRYITCAFKVTKTSISEQSKGEAQDEFFADSTDVVSYFA